MARSLPTNWRSALNFSLRRRAPRVNFLVALDTVPPRSRWCRLHSTNPGWGGTVVQAAQTEADEDPQEGRVIHPLPRTPTPQLLPPLLHSPTGYRHLLGDLSGLTNLPTENVDHAA